MCGAVVNVGQGSSAAQAICRLTLLSTHAERLFAVVGPGAGQS